jgi:TPR repeat protein
MTGSSSPQTPPKLSAKVKKPTCAAGTGSTPIASDCKGQILPGKPEELHASAKEAAKAGDNTKAAHFYTMAIDVLAKGLKRDSRGVAADADLAALNKSSEGLLAELLCGRSHVYLRQKDVDAAMEDADTCARADPASEKGHLRLAVAYEAAGVGLAQQLEACERAVEACPHSEVLVARKWRLKKAIAGQGDVAESKQQGEQQVSQPWGIEQTQRLADDSSDPRHMMAATDLGRAFAAGAHGLEKDLDAAVRYLRIGVQGGDVSAQRDLGLLFLEMGQPVEASEHLKAAAEAGDEEAGAALQQLVGEAQERQKEARAMLEKMAEAGDPRARAMLAELDA